MVRLDFCVAPPGLFFCVVIDYKQAAPSKLSQAGKSLA